MTDQRVSRRRLLGYSGVTLAAGAAAGAGLVSVAEAHEGGPDVDGSVPFFGAHQSGIATPVQDRLHFASFDVITDDRARLVRMLKDWTAAGAALTARPPVRLGGRRAAGGAARRHRRGARAALRPADAHRRLRAHAVRQGRQGPVRPQGAAPGPADRPAALSRRQPRRRPQRRRHLRPGVRRRPAGGGARHPQPRPDRLRRGRRALVPARLRQDLLDDAGPADTAQHVRLQGRHPQHLRRRPGGAGPARLGVGQGRRRVDGRRVLPRRAAHPHAHRDVGPHLAQGAAGRLRPDEGRGQPVRRQARARPGAARASCPPTPTYAWRTRTATAAYASCAAATPSPTAATGSGGSTPACSSSPTSATRERSSSCCRTASPAPTT